MSNTPIYFDRMEDGSIGVSQGKEDLTFDCLNDFERFLEVCNTFVRQCKSEAAWPTIEMTEAEAKEYLKQ